MTDLNQESTKAVTVSVTVGNADRYEFTVDVPRTFINRRSAHHLIGTSASGGGIKLGYLGPAVMNLLSALDNASAFECPSEDGTCWVLLPDKKRKAWRQLRTSVSSEPK